MPTVIIATINYGSGTGNSRRGGETMDVFIVLRDTPNCISVFCGVFSTKETAEKWLSIHYPGFSWNESEQYYTKEGSELSFEIEKKSVVTPDKLDKFFDVHILQDGEICVHRVLFKASETFRKLLARPDVIKIVPVE